MQGAADARQLWQSDDLSSLSAGDFRRAAAAALLGRPVAPQRTKRCCDQSPHSKARRHVRRMTFGTLIRRSLRFHWRSHLGVVIGAVIRSAALIGALIVGIR